MIIVAGPTVEEPPTPPVVKPQVRLAVHLTGVDGSLWDLTSGPVHLGRGPVGFGHPGVEHGMRDAAGLDGSGWYGFRHLPREVRLPVHALDGGDNWLDVDGAFAQAIDPAGECVLTVTRPNGKQRTLRVRYVGGGDVPFELDPLMVGYGEYSELQFIAADPFWRGNTISRSFTVEEPQDLFPGPPFWINSGEATATATIRNVGDVQVWPLYEARGVCDGFTAGVGDNLVVYDAPIASGSDAARIIVDTDPRQQTVLTGTGADAWPGVIERSFAPIPPGDDVPLAVALDSPDATAVITVTLTPRYWRAW